MITFLSAYDHEGSHIETRRDRQQRPDGGALRFRAMPVPVRGDALSLPREYPERSLDVAAAALLRVRGSRSPHPERAIGTRFTAGCGR